MTKLINITSLNDCFEKDSPFCKVSFEDNLHPSPINALSKGYDVTQNVSRLSEIYASFIGYFGNVMCSKYRHMEGGLCAYIAKIKSGIQFGSRVLVAVVEEDQLSIGAMRTLESLHWLNFQTRFIAKEIPIRDVLCPEVKDILMNAPIERTSKTDLRSEYRVEGFNELRVTLHRKKESIRDWSNRNRLFVALNEFCCSVDIV